jgi:hypothetical protein
MTITARSYRSRRLIVAALIGAVATAACADRSDSPAGPNPGTPPAGTPAPGAPNDAVAEVSVDGNVTVEPGESRQIDAVVRSASGALLTGRAIAWSSSDTTVATVGPTGVLTGRAVGSVVVSATSGGKRGEGTVRVITPRPRPTLRAIYPDTVVAGAPNTTITLIGGGFAEGAWVRIAGGVMISTVESDSVIRVELHTGHFITPGDLAIRVLNLPPGGGESDTLRLTVVPDPAARPRPELSATTPSALVVGSGAQTMTLHGANFVPESVVRFNGRDRVTTFIDAGTLSVPIEAADVAGIREWYVEVWTPRPGGGSSGIRTLRVVAP